MEFYVKVPADFLIAFYEEINKNIQKGILSKNMYYELGLIIFVARQRNIVLDKPRDFEQIVNPRVLNDFIQFANKSHEI